MYKRDQLSAWNTTKFLSILCPVIHSSVELSTQASYLCLQLLVPFDRVQKNHCRILFEKHVELIQNTLFV